MAAIDQAMVSKILNATTPNASGNPAAFTTLTNAFKLKLTSTASTASASGTEIASGGGYVTGGQAILGNATNSSAGSNVSIPSTALSWVNSSGGNWSIVSLELLDGAGLRTWFGNFTGQPVVVASGNTFQIAISGITIALT